jgi:biopolymer transport protein ExbD
MTAMCDVAFLLLSFFILTTKFKPSEALAVTIPSSVEAKIAPSDSIVLITIDNKGKVFLSMDEKNPEKEQIIQAAASYKNVMLSAAQLKALAAQPFIGVPIANLSQQLAVPKDKLTNAAMPGIPVQDTTKNEMNEWMRALNEVYLGKKMNLLMKGDNDAKYPSFNNVVKAMKKNNITRFKIVTNMEGVPKGTALAQVPEKERD